MASTSTSATDDTPTPALDVDRVHLGPRRRLQLALAVIWLFDGALQFQPFMFTQGFATQIVAPTAQGNPGVIARPITWAAGLVEHHCVAANAAFAVIQVLLGVAIAWRPAVKFGLGISIVWSLGVWWFGEGLGGVLTGNATPVTGAPGAALLYAVLAALIWPSERPGPFIAAQPIGVSVARSVWVALWGALVFLALQPANTGAQSMHDIFTNAAQGQARWLRWTDLGAADLAAHRGLAASIVLAVAFGVIALGVLLPARFARAVIVLALVVALMIWIAGEDLGGTATGQATDPNSGPLLVLLALAYLPVNPRPRRRLRPPENSWGWNS